ncbi:hypothetical protein GCM10011379_20260 [Filimonas zeae]|uniref:Uncharacterized protein n=1 Tax=Filimonas zeae TaxID=1737353 RepID=A0A917IW11_9BACT|nr:hypothetical protein GCM10011379_20260 [Filimonas zeae]
MQFVYSTVQYTFHYAHFNVGITEQKYGKSYYNTILIDFYVKKVEMTLYVQQLAMQACLFYR